MIEPAQRAQGPQVITVEDMRNWHPPLLPPSMQWSGTYTTNAEGHTAFNITGVRLPGDSEFTPLSSFTNGYPVQSVSIDMNDPTSIRTIMRIVDGEMNIRDIRQEIATIQRQRQQGSFPPSPAPMPQIGGLQLGIMIAADTVSHGLPPKAQERTAPPAPGKAR